MAARTRADMFNDPDSYVGQTKLVLFSKEEIDANPGLSLQPGVASVVGQGGGDPTWEEIRNAVQLKGGEKHMNVMVSSGKWIGGNLSDTTSVVNDNEKAGFMILVKVTGYSEPKSKRLLAKLGGEDQFDYISNKKDADGNEYQVWKEKETDDEFWVLEQEGQDPIVYLDNNGQLETVDKPKLAAYVASGSSDGTEVV